MSFFRYGKIYQSDGPKVGAAYCSAYLATIVPMSLQPAIPSWVALQQSPCPLHRSFTASLSTLLLYSHQQRTVNCLHFPCLNTGVHSKVSQVIPSMKSSLGLPVAHGDAHPEKAAGWHSSQPMAERQRCRWTESSGPQKFYMWSSRPRPATPNYLLVRKTLETSF
jgi:hypothetical protein